MLPTDTERKSYSCYVKAMAAVSWKLLPETPQPGGYDILFNLFIGMKMKLQVLHWLLVCFSTIVFFLYFQMVRMGGNKVRWWSFAWLNWWGRLVEGEMAKKPRTWLMLTLNKDIPSSMRYSKPIGRAWTVSLPCKVYSIQLQIQNSTHWPWSKNSYQCLCISAVRET